MTRKWISLLFLFATLFYSLFTLKAPVRAESPANGPFLQASDNLNAILIAQLRQQTDLVVQISYHDETGAVSFIGTTPDHAIPQPAILTPNASPEEAARGFLATYGPLFGLQNQAEELILISTRTLDDADDGRSFVRLRQVYEGLPVIGGELIVQLNAKQEILSANGEILPDLTLNTTPAIDPQTARQLALQKVAKDVDVNIEELIASEAELSIYNPILLGGPGPRFEALVWRVDVTPLILAPVNSIVLVDAKLGVIALHFNLTFDVKKRIVYDNNNNSTLGLPGIDLVRREGEAATGITDIDLAYTYTGDTYDFFMNEHDRDSLDDAGIELLSTVRYCPNNTSCPYQNAFWDGTQMVFGEGHAAADDVVAHELTHGVTQFTSDLFYYYQSGAINESLSDLWGEFVDLTNGAGTDTPDVRWQIGEDIPELGAVRNMQDPTLFLHPDQMGSDLYWCGEIDNGGVHINSGVNNKAIYLMTDGGTFNGYTVTGMGISKVADLYYEVQSNLLTSAADYGDLYDLLLQASDNLAYSASERQNIQKALDAVQMKQPPRSCPFQQAPVCASGEPTDLFFDDFEAGEDKWSVSSQLGELAWFVPQEVSEYLAHPYTVSGQKSLWGYYQFDESDTAIAMKNEIILPDVAFMHFHHAFAFEFDAKHATYYDGGVVEYSTDGGQTWQDADQFFTHNGYNSKLEADNPLGKRAAFAASSPGYTSSRLDLSPLAGQKVKVRFRLGTDGLGEDYGWFIDDVRLYTCSQPEADLALEATSREAVAADEPLTYTLTISNQGPYRATNIILSDTLPSDVTFRSASGATCEQNDGNDGIVSCALEAIQSGASHQVTLVVTAPEQGGEISNQASVRAAEPDLYNTNNSATTITRINPTDLLLTRTANPSVVIGESFFYTLTVSNNGAFAAPNVVLTDSLPSNVTLQSVDTSQGSCDQNDERIRCALGTVDKQASATVTVALTAPKQLEPINHLASAAGAELDIDPSNNLNIENSTFVTNPPTPRYVAPNGKDEGACSDASKPCQTIAYAATQAAFGDTVNLAAGRYRENVTLNQELTVQGDGVDETIIDANQAGSAFGIEKQATITINDLTINNGSGSLCTADERACGGGIYNLGTLTVNRSRFTENKADWAGGAIYNQHLLTVNESEFIHNNATWAGAIYNLGTLTVNESDFSNNEATRGGGIYNWAAQATVNRSTFSDNQAAWGGGIHNLGTLSIKESTFENNQTTWGGGLYNWQGDATVEQSTFRANRATGHPNSFGGGLYNWGGTVNISQSTIISNTTSNSGGGINSFFGKLIVDKSTISHNRVTNLDGGAINGSGIIELSNSTLSGNRVGNEGGAIWYYEGTLTLNHVTISDNHAPNGGHALSITNTIAVNLKNTLIANDIAAGPNCIAQQDASISSLGHNLANDNSCHLTHPTDQPNTHASEAPLADNGGPTHTHALLPGSPAMNAGDCNNQPSNMSDQRGIERNVKCDIGAYEDDTNEPSPLMNAWRTIAPCFGVRPFAVARWEAWTKVSVGNGLCLVRNWP